MVRVAIDAACWGNRRGYGRYMREVLGALWEIDRENEYVLVADTQTELGEGIPDRIPVRKAKLAQSPLEGASAGSNRSLRDVMAMSRLARSEPCDVFFFSSVYTYFPYFGPGRVAVVFHDAIAERHPEQIFPNKRSQLFWNIKTRLAIHEADRIVTVSDYSRRELAEVFDLPESEIIVASEGPSRIFLESFETPLEPEQAALANLKPGDRYFVYAGGFAPHKNLVALVEQYASLVEAHCADAPLLVMIGEYAKETFHSNFGDLSRAIESHGVAERVRFTGFISDADLATLFANAVALVLPSLREGFGLPAVEAAAAGTPVVATNRSPLPEVLEGGGIFIDPEKPEELRSALEVMAYDEAERARMALAARQRAEALSWRKSAEVLKHCFEELGHGRS